MARGRKKTKLADLPAQPDPKAPLDSATFLSSATPVLDLLTKDLLARADGDEGITRALKARHAFEKEKQLTADKYEVWRRHVVVQIAAAWLLSCVFVRTLEDRGLVKQNRIAGPGAMDAEHLFCLQLAPYLTERDYLLAVFTELERVPACKELFDREHNLAWRLAPSAAATKELLGLFRTPDPAAPAFRFGQSSTRFLGDLYQDLSEDVRKRFALLQTPDFVETFILDRTLEPAVEEFGLGETTVIDPTCGSGHFLLGAFGRLFERWCAAEPGGTVESAVEKALGAVYGVDVNPYAVGIAKFRLTLAALEKLGVREIGKAPRLGLNVVVADSLLHNYSKGQKDFGDLEEQESAVWKSPAFAMQDERGAKSVLGREFAAVVGNPPYITVKDKALRDAYRDVYASAFREYSLAAPFMERFFQLGRPAAFVGQITANSFMKREFGKKLIEEVLPRVDLTTIVNTAGAYIPGHGTPTVLIFGRSRAPVGERVHAVLARRGEPTTPEDPAEGKVWSSIRNHWSEDGFENKFITVDSVERVKLGRHPWSLEGGGAADLKALLEERATTRLAELVDLIGFGAVTREDDVFVLPAGAARRFGIHPDHVLPYGSGEVCRDWVCSPGDDILFPYTPEGTADPSRLGRYYQVLWCYRSQLWARVGKGFKTKKESGGEFYEYSMFYHNRHFCPLRIAFAFVATHNHFVLDRGGKVFNRSAPIIKLPDTATEDDHLALIAYLNSSTACFWMKQVFYPKASAVGDISTEKGKAEANRYEFAGTGLQALPIAPWDAASRGRAIELAREASNLAGQLGRLDGRHVVDLLGSGESRAEAEVKVERQRAELQHRLVFIQEEIDWLGYRSFGLTDAQPVASGAAPAEARPFARSETHPSWKEREEQLHASKQLRLLEDPVFKRLWLGRQGVFGHGTKTLREEVDEAITDALLDEAEDVFKNAPSPLLMRASELSRVVGGTSVGRRAAAEGRMLARADVDAVAVPYLTPLYLTNSGIEKRVAWEATWEHQRREDQGEKVGEIPVPPKYDQKDFRDVSAWRHRGKLDVPNERFISYPGCQSDQDNEPVYGWAGWDHAQRAQALAGLYVARKDEEAWSTERLLPMLGGLVELLPWLKQWHNDLHPDYGQGLGNFFENWLAEECRSCGVAPHDLHRLGANGGLLGDSGLTRRVRKN